MSALSQSIPAGITIDFPKQFNGHTAQQLVWESNARFIDIMAGRRGGKDHIGVRKALKNIYRDLFEEKGYKFPDISNGIPRLHYWFCAPTYSLTKVITKHLIKAIHPRMIKRNRLAGSQPHIWLVGDILIEFKSTNNPETLVGEGLNGIYMTETARHKPSVWNDNLRPTLSENQGWAIFTTTPLGYNWYMDDIRALAESDDYPEWEAFYWKTRDNVVVPGIVEEAEKARATMPLKYYLRNYEASPDAFHGQIYDNFVPDIHVQDFFPDLGKYKTIVGGIDWGYSHNGCIVVVGITNDDDVELIDIVSESGILAVSSDPEQRSWQSIARELKGKYNVEIFFAGVDEPDHIQAFQQADIPVLKAKNSVSPGIQFVSHLLHVDGNGMTKLRIPKKFEWLKKCFTRYKWKYDDKNGVSKEEPEKVDDDEMDAIRYALYSAYRFGLFNIQLSYLEDHEESK